MRTALLVLVLALVAGAGCEKDTIGPEDPTTTIPILESEARITVALETMANDGPLPVDPPVSLEEAKNRQAAALEVLARRCYCENPR